MGWPSASPQGTQKGAALAGPVRVTTPPKRRRVRQRIAPACGVSPGVCGVSAWEARRPAPPRPARRRVGAAPLAGVAPVQLPLPARPAAGTYTWSPRASERPSRRRARACAATAAASRSPGRPCCRPWAPTWRRTSPPPPPAAAAAAPCAPERGRGQRQHTQARQPPPHHPDTTGRSVVRPESTGLSIPIPIRGLRLKNADRNRDWKQAILTSNIYPVKW